MIKKELQLNSIPPIYINKLVCDDCQEEMVCERILASNPQKYVYKCPKCGKEITLDEGFPYVAKEDKIQVKCINTGNQELPKYATPQSSGCDVRANITEPYTLHPLERHLFPTGLKIALPDGYECQVRPRSGLAFKYGITVLNTPGTIDADYRGELGVVLINLSNEDFTVNPSERIAQLVFSNFVQGEFVKVDYLDETERGEGGYGHSGVK